MIDPLVWMQAAVLNVGAGDDEVGEIELQLHRSDDDGFEILRIVVRHASSPVSPDMEVFDVVEEEGPEP